MQRRPDGNDRHILHENIASTLIKHSPPVNSTLVKKYMPCLCDLRLHNVRALPRLHAVPNPRQQGAPRHDGEDTRSIPLGVILRRLSFNIAQLVLKTSFKSRPARPLPFLRGHLKVLRTDFWSAALQPTMNRLNCVNQ